MVIYAEERSCTTQFELGELFYQRKGGTQEYDQALKWFKRAAINGSRQAQHRLGTMYARGHGVTEPGAGLAGVPSEHDPAIAAAVLEKLVGEGCAEAPYGRGIERRFPRDRADAVGSEQPLQEVGLPALMRTRTLLRLIELIDRRGLSCTGRSL